MIKIETVKKGAELVSLQVDGFEKMHDGVEFWNRHSPILFPIVGKLKDGKTIIEGKEYEMGQHGFARDMEFEEIGDNSYVLRYNEETLKKYPYKFELYVSYELDNFKNKVFVKYKVKNVDDKKIYFGLGGHPAFNCEYSSGKYRLEFDKEEEEIEFYQLQDGLLVNYPLDKRKFMRENRIFLDKDIFNNDAIIMKNIFSDRVFLKTENKLILTFGFDKFNYLAIWSKPGASFLCIEPWFNTADHTDSDGVFKNKDNIIELEPENEFDAEYWVRFNS